MLSFACALSLGLSVTAASAQVVVSIGNSRARDCYLAAKNGFASDYLVKICNASLQEENLSLKDRAATFDNRGILESRLGRADQALSSYSAAIATMPSLGDAYVNRGTILIQQRKYEDALADINRGIGFGMSSPPVGYYNRAVAEQLMGRYRDAYDDYMQTLKLEPAFAAAREQLKFFRVIRREGADEPIQAE
jgi:tetratricopeptide (TPR) repeat protein